jgi:hypothetical protein
MNRFRLRVSNSFSSKERAVASILNHTENFNYVIVIKSIHVMIVSRNRGPRVEMLRREDSSRHDPLNN